jgi:hypothetical protein
MTPPTDRLFDQSGRVKATLALEAFAAQLRELAEGDPPPDPVPAVVEPPSLADALAR